MNLQLEIETEAFRAWTEELTRDMSGPGRRNVLNGLAFEFLGRVIKRTPVDTGRARGGWASYLLANGKPVAKQGTGWAQGVKEGLFVESFSGREGSIALVNAVPYIVFLEFGYSQQAPQGMMRLTLREMRARGLMSDAVAKQLERTITQANRTFRSRYRKLPG